MKMDRLDGWRKIISRFNAEKSTFLRGRQSFLSLALIIILSLDKLIKTSKEGDEMFSHTRKGCWHANQGRNAR